MFLYKLINKVETIIRERTLIQYVTPYATINLVKMSEDFQIGNIKVLED